MFTADPDEHRRVLEERAGPDLDDELRKLGLYHPVRQVHTLAPIDGNPLVVMVLTVTVGDLALAPDRPPESDEHTATIDRFLDTRQRWLAP